MAKARPLKITETQLRRALASLGRTQGAVARALKRRKIRGSHNPSACPIAMFLRQRYHVKPSQVGTSVPVDIGESYIVFDGARLDVTPRPIAEFIDRFDSGDYRELYV